jgi:hypothetical protein
MGKSDKSGPQERHFSPKWANAHSKWANVHFGTAMENVWKYSLEIMAH